MSKIPLTLLGDELQIGILNDNLEEEIFTLNKWKMYDAWVVARSRPLIALWTKEDAEEMAERLSDEESQYQVYHVKVGALHDLLRKENEGYD